jgi:hypothetical protein
MSNKELCERYIRIIKAHPMHDDDVLKKIVAGKELDFSTMNDLSKYYDYLDKNDERNSHKRFIEQNNLNEVSEEFDKETETNNVDWDGLRQQKFDEFLEGK